MAAEYGHLDCLKYLHETAKAPWDYRAVRKAHKTTKPNVYNTSSTTTVLSHLVGLTKMERYAHQKNKKKRKRKKEISTTGKKENTGKKKRSTRDEKRHYKTQLFSS